MKNIFKILITLALIVLGYFVVLQLYPRNAGRYPFLVILLAGDYYFWASFKNWVFSKKPLLKYVLGLLYWLPFLLLISSTLAGFYIPSQEWDQSLRTYLFGFIFITYAAKVIPIIFLLLADIFRGFQLFNRKVTKLAIRAESSKQGNKISRSQFLQKVGLISGGLMFSGLLLGMLKWAFDFI